MVSGGGTTPRGTGGKPRDAGADGGIVRTYILLWVYCEK